MKYTQDDLYILIDFLEEELENSRKMEYVGYSEDELLEFECKATLYEMNIEVIKSLIKE